MTDLGLQSLALEPVLWGLAGEAGFVAVLFAGSLVLPGRTLPGVLRPDGTRIAYRLNGFGLFVLAMLAAFAVELFGPGLAPIARNLWSLLLAANLLAVPASLLLFRSGRGVGRGTLAGFVFGVERDPSLFGVDLKMFSYRPSLIGLALMALSCLSLQRAGGPVSLPMALYIVLLLVYIANYFQFEHGMVFTWDIVEERFGLMLVWGDYVLVPFFYALPAFYVAARSEPLSWPAAAATVALYALGFWVFRGANDQKHRFKRDPRARIWGRPAAALGGRLLVSGFWGIGRKLNYSGELILYAACCSLAGTASAVPYLLFAWLLVLLTHRAGRDDRRCRAKYGPLWDEYCALVRFRMFPGIEGWWRQPPPQRRAGR